MPQHQSAAIFELIRYWPRRVLISCAFDLMMLLKLRHTRYRIMAELMTTFSRHRVGPPSARRGAGRAMLPTWARELDEAPAFHTFDAGRFSRLFTFHGISPERPPRRRWIRPHAHAPIISPFLPRRASAPKATPRAWGKYGKKAATSSMPKDALLPTPLPRRLFHFECWRAMALSRAREYRRMPEYVILIDILMTLPSRRAFSSCALGLATMHLAPFRH